MKISNHIELIIIITTTTTADDDDYLSSLVCADNIYLYISTRISWKREGEREREKKKKRTNLEK